LAIAVDKGAADVSLIPKVGVHRYHQEFLNLVNLGVIVEE